MCYVMSGVFIVCVEGGEISEHDNGVYSRDAVECGTMRWNE